MTAPDPRSRGIALVVVLWVVTILALQVSVFNLTVRDAASLGTNEMAMARGEQLAASAIELAAARILDTDPLRQWPPDGRVRSVPFGGAILEIDVTDESGRFDINGANQDMLAAALYPLARSSATTTEWVERILDWRDNDDERRPSGAETEDYARAGLRYAPRNGPFLHPLELGRVLGFPADLAYALAGRLTVFGLDGKVNPLTATREVLLMLPGVNPAEVDYALDLRRQPGIKAETVVEALPSLKDWLSTNEGTVFRIGVQVREDSQTAFGRAEALIVVDRSRRGGQQGAPVDPTPPFHVLHWSYEPRTGRLGDQRRR
jgi:general secretion pathway protein K